MQTYIASGRGDAREAFLEATYGLKMPNVIIFQSTKKYIKEVAKLIQNAYPNAISIGTISKVQYENGEILKDALSILAFFDDVEADCGVIKELKTCPVLYIDSLIKSVKRVDPGEGDTICLEFCTGNEQMLMSTMDTYLKNLPVPVIGSTAFSDFDFSESIVALNGEVYKDACVYLIIKNKTGKIRVYNENLYNIESRKFYIATDISKDKKKINSLDNKPAADVYCDAIGIERKNIMDNVLFHPFATSIKDKLHISAIRKVNSDGSMELLNKINKNSCIYILSPKDYTKIERENIEKIKKDAQKISLILSYDCVHRYQYYEKEGYIKQYLKNFSNLGPHFGMIVAGEQYKTRHMNQSMVCAVFE